jgi:nucleotide-binding universal stress UspA family protein
VRGTVTRASLAAADDVDLVVIGQQGRSPRVMTGEYLPERAKVGQCVIAVCDGSPSAIRTLELAKGLADPSPMVVLVLANNTAHVSHQCMTWLEEQNVRAKVDQAPHPTKDAIIEFVKQWSPSVLLIDRDSAFIDEAQICRLVNDVECPLILC